MRMAGVSLAAALMAVLLAEAAPGQFVPYRSSGSYGWGPYPQVSSSVVNRGVVAAQEGADRRQGVALSARRQENMNQYLMGQAQRNTAWASQNTAQINQLRLQQMQRESAQVAALNRLGGAPAGTSPAPTTMLPLATAGGSTTPATRPASPPPTEGTGWPSLLGAAQFAEPRAELEKLLAADAASEAGLTSEEYKEIVAAAGQMKEILRGMAGRLNAAEYLLVDDFLNELIAKYQAKAEPTKPRGN